MKILSPADTSSLSSSSFTSSTLATGPAGAAFIYAIASITDNVLSGEVITFKIYEGTTNNFKKELQQARISIDRVELASCLLRKKNIIMRNNLRHNIIIKNGSRNNTEGNRMATILTIEEPVSRRKHIVTSLKKDRYC